MYRLHTYGKMTQGLRPRLHDQRTRDWLLQSLATHCCTYQPWPFRSESILKTSMEQRMARSITRHQPSRNSVTLHAVGRRKLCRSYGQMQVSDQVQKLSPGKMCPNLPDDACRQIFLTPVTQPRKTHLCICRQDRKAPSTTPYPSQPCGCI